MGLRVGFDVDGVLADFPAAYRDVEARAGGAAAKSPEVWDRICGTTDFWLSLTETEAGIVRRLHGQMLRHRWDVFFITQRPATEGAAVQRQTQRWLVAHGFDLPSVFVAAGSRGAVAAALSLDYHVDDSAKNCIDVRLASSARVLQIVDACDDAAMASARRLGITPLATTSAALDVLERASTRRGGPGVRLARLVGLTP